METAIQLTIQLISDIFSSRPDIAGYGIIMLYAVAKIMLATGIYEHFNPDAEPEE